MCGGHTYDAHVNGTGLFTVSHRGVNLFGKYGQTATASYIKWIYVYT